MATGERSSRIGAVNQGLLGHGARGAHRERWHERFLEEKPLRELRALRGSKVSGIAFMPCGEESDPGRDFPWHPPRYLGGYSPPASVSEGRCLEQP